MKKLMLAASLALAAPAQAQHAKINVGPGGFQMSFRGPDGRDRDEAFQLSYEPMRRKKPSFRIASPEGARAEVYEGKRRVARDRIPFSFEAKAKTTYRVVIDLPGGGRFEEKIDTRKGQDTTLWVHVPYRKEHDRDRHDWRDRDQRREEHSHTVIENTAEGFRLEFKRRPDRRTTFEVLSPAGLNAKVFDGKRLVANQKIPLSFEAVPDRHYRFVVTAANGSVWEKSFAARRGEEGSLFVYPPSTGPVVVHPPARPPVVIPPPHPAHPPPPVHPSRPVHPGHPPHPAQPARPVAMAVADFRALLDAISKDPFPAGKMRVLTTAAPNAWFTIDQVGALVDAFTFPSDKVKVVEVTRSRIIDRENAFKLYSQFTFPNDKEAVRKLLAH